MLALIAAHDPNLVIGKAGDLPWHYSEDLKHFKRTTMGHPLLMGRVVFEELNEKPLPGRQNIVLSRSKTYAHVPTFGSIEPALNYLSDADLIFCIGGGKVYEQLLPRADRLYITQIKKAYEGDTYFPEYRPDIGSIWQESSRDERDNLTFLMYDRTS